MQQLLLTRTADSAPWTVHARTAGIDPHRLAALEALTVYTPQAGSSPTRLALLHTPDAGRFLAHTVQHNGQSVAHVLLDVADTIDAHQVIQTWGSPLWIRDPDHVGADLPQMLYLPVADQLTEAALRDFLQPPARRELLSFVLAAVLSAGPGERVFVAAPPNDVALCLYGLARALPAGLLDDFTFSTYEADPLACQARLVGSELPADADLPDVCYGTGGLAIHADTGRHSELTAAVPFADFAVDALATGKHDALDDFRSTWQRLGVRQPAYLDLVYRLARGTGALTQDESRDALQNPALAAWISTRADALQQFLDWALDDRQFASDAFSRAVVALRQKPDLLAKLAQTVQERGLQALKASDTLRTSNAYEVVLPMVAPAKAATVWADVLAKVPDPTAISWEMRWYLLPRLLRLKPLAAGQGIEPALAPWLHVPPDQLAALLALDLPRPYPVLAALDTLGETAEPPPEAVQALAGQPTLVPNLLVRLHALPDGPARTQALFAALIACSPTHPWALDLLKAGRGLPVSLLDSAVRAAIDAGQAEAGTILREQGAAVRELLAGQPALEELHKRYLDQPPADLLHQAPMLDHLRAIADDSALSEGTRERLRAVLTVEAFAREPSVEADRLVTLAAALRLKPDLFPPTLFATIQHGVGEQLAHRAESPTVQTDLEAALQHLGGFADGGATGLYRELLRGQTERRLFARQPQLLHAFLAVALGAVQSMDVAHALDDLETEGFRLASLVAKRGGRKVTAEIDAKSASWPQGARRQWNYLLKAVRPRGLRGVARDAVFFLMGAAVALGVAFVWRMLKS